MQWMRTMIMIMQRKNSTRCKRVRRRVSSDGKKLLLKQMKEIPEISNEGIYEKSYEILICKASHQLKRLRQVLGEIDVSLWSRTIHRRRVNIDDQKNATWGYSVVAQHANRRRCQRSWWHLSEYTKSWQHWIKAGSSRHRTDLLILDEKWERLWTEIVRFEEVQKSVWHCAQNWKMIYMLQRLCVDQVVRNSLWNFWETSMMSLRSLSMTEISYYRARLSSNQRRDTCLQSGWHECVVKEFSIEVAINDVKSVLRDRRSHVGRHSKYDKLFPFCWTRVHFDISSYFLRVLIEIGTTPMTTKWTTLTMRHTKLFYWVHYWTHWRTRRDAFFHDRKRIIIVRKCACNMTRKMQYEERHTWRVSGGMDSKFRWIRGAF